MHPDDEIKLVCARLKRIRAVKAIYLFGSYAKGENRPFSDIDMCVIAGKKMSKKTRENILSNSSNKFDISLFWMLPINIRFRVVREGRLLFCRDELFLHRAKIKAIKDYLDFKYILNRASAQVLNV